ncbi:hypothetical protein [Candidatus Phytoplasma sp. AldY-WA1]|uniref:hypothetical protein n=1 Tax=Candidatus Phytoplasma sp. AldY-WA1 TaxID=2852100 RepID=UPI002549E3C6|nr:hypothetical protein [Candidatus Phytoplasma sp. AldY-WA1]
MYARNINNLKLLDGISTAEQRKTEIQTHIDKVKKQLNEIKISRQFYYRQLQKYYITMAVKYENYRKVSKFLKNLFLTSIEKNI